MGKMAGKKRQQGRFVGRLRWMELLRAPEGARKIKSPEIEETQAAFPDRIGAGSSSMMGNCHRP